jgi:hypothetical protein
LAESTKNVCSLQATVTEHVVKINDIPSFFYKVHPSGKYISFIGSQGNQLLDMETGRTIPLPGGIDPVFTSDGKYLVVPMFRDEYKGPLSPGAQVLLYDGSNLEMQASKMTFYDANTFVNRLKNKKMPKVDPKEFNDSLYRDEVNNGVYQSIAAKKDGSYSLISDKRGVTIQNYKISKSGSSAGELISPCANITEFPTDLPIISKDGRFLSVNNTQTNSTQIYELLNNEECSLSLDLGFSTGKVSFNKDSSKIAFHMDHFNESTGGYFSGTPTDIIKDVYTMNLQHSKNDKGNVTLKPTTWAKVTNTERLGNGSYYPDFADNDDLFYLSDVENYFQFSKVNLNQLTYTPFDNYIDLTVKPKENSCTQLSDKALGKFLLGQIWGKACAKLGDINVKDSAILSMSLDAKNCKDLVIANWDEAFKSQLIKSYAQKINLSSLASLSKNDLIAACPSNKPAPQVHKTVGAWDKRDAANFKEVLKQKCISCHSNTIEYKKEINAKVFYDENGTFLKVEKTEVLRKMPAIDANNMDIKTANKLVTAVSNKDPKNRMPKGNSLKASEIQLFYDNAKILELSTKLNEELYEFDRPLTVSTYSDEKIQNMIQEFKEAMSTNLSSGDKTISLEKYKKEVLCQYKQSQCKELITDKLQSKRMEVKALNKNISTLELDNLISRESIKLRCRYTFEVLFENCKDIQE